MNHLGQYLHTTLHHKRLTNSSGAIAGLASGISVVVGMIAAHFAPRGMHRITMALHLAKKPLILKVAPIIAGIAVAIVTAAGILRFYSWCMEREEDR